MSADLQSTPGATDAVACVERYELSGDRLVRRVSRRDGTVSETDAGDAPTVPLGPASLHALADQRYLQAKERPAGDSSGASLALVDLFSGTWREEETANIHRGGPAGASPGSRGAHLQSGATAHRLSGQPGVGEAEQHSKRT